MAVMLADRPGATGISAAHVTPTLHDGASVACPNCGRRQPAVCWRPLARPAAYADQLVPVYRCGHCRYVFAPLPQNP